MDLMAWTDMETFQRIPRTMQDKRNKKAKEIRNGYLNSKFFFGSESPATKEAQNLVSACSFHLFIFISSCNYYKPLT